MITKVIFRDEWVVPYLTAAYAAARGYAAIWPPEEIELLKQTIALCNAAANIESHYPLPPDAAPLRTALGQAVKQMHADFYVGDQEGSLEEVIHVLNMWNTLFHHVSARLAMLEKTYAPIIK